MFDELSLFGFVGGFIILLAALSRFAFVRKLFRRTDKGQDYHHGSGEILEYDEAAPAVSLAPALNFSFGLTEAVVGLALIVASTGFSVTRAIKAIQGDSWEVVLPSRIFAATGQYPPKQFKAYGIVAFGTGPTSADRARYDMICEAYVSGLLHYTKVEAPPQKQMVTVWPVESSEWSERINAEARQKVCADAVPHYGIELAQDAILAANRAGAGLGGLGPFLIAWSPGDKKGQPDALVLVADMSDVINNEQAKQIFARWAIDIQENPELWNRGWDQEKLKLVIRLWVDKWGAKILQAINMKD